MNAPAKEPLQLPCLAAIPFRSAYRNGVTYPGTARAPSGSRVATELLRVALTGQPRARREIVLLLIPTVQSRVRKTLDAFASQRGRPIKDRDISDLTQQVLLSMVDQDARILRAWDPTAGTPLFDFVGGVAERQAEAILRGERPRKALDAGPLVGAQGLFRDDLATLYRSFHEKLRPQERALFGACVTVSGRFDATNGVGATRQGVVRSFPHGLAVEPSAEIESSSARLARRAFP